MMPLPPSSLSCLLPHSHFLNSSSLFFPSPLSFSIFAFSASQNKHQRIRNNCYLVEPFLSATPVGYLFGSSQQPYEIDVIVPILQIEMLRPSNLPKVTQLDYDRAEI